MSLLLILIAILVACSSEIDESGTEALKGTDNVVVSSIAEIEYYTFDEAMNKVDLIAEVQINNVVGEIEVPIDKTIFEVEVINVLLGNVDQKYIKILQLGTEKVRFNDIDLFKIGEKYVLFLRETIDFPDADYWIQGEAGGVYKEVDNKLVKLLGEDDELQDVQIVESSEIRKPQEYRDRQVLDKELFFRLIRDIAESMEE